MGKAADKAVQYGLIMDVIDGYLNYNIKSRELYANAAATANKTPDLFQWEGGQGTFQEAEASGLPYGKMGVYQPPGEEKPTPDPKYYQFLNPQTNQWETGTDEQVKDSGATQFYTQGTRPNDSTEPPDPLETEPGRRQQLLDNINILYKHKDRDKELRMSWVEKINADEDISKKDFETYMNGIKDEMDYEGAQRDETEKLRLKMQGDVDIKFIVKTYDKKMNKGGGGTHMEMGDFKFTAGQSKDDYEPSMALDALKRVERFQKENNLQGILGQHELYSFLMDATLTQLTDYGFKGRDGINMKDDENAFKQMNEDTGEWESQIVSNEVLGDIEVIELKNGDVYVSAIDDYKVDGKEGDYFYKLSKNKTVKVKDHDKFIMGENGQPVLGPNGQPQPNPHFGHIVEKTLDMTVKSKDPTGHTIYPNVQKWLFGWMFRLMPSVAHKGMKKSGFGQQQGDQQPGFGEQNMNRDIQTSQ